MRSGHEDVRSQKFQYRTVLAIDHAFYIWIHKTEHQQVSYLTEIALLPGTVQQN